MKYNWEVVPAIKNALAILKWQWHDHKISLDLKLYIQSKMNLNDRVCTGEEIKNLLYSAGEMVTR